MPNSDLDFERLRTYELTGDQLIVLSAAIATSVIAAASRLSPPAKRAIYDGFLSNESFATAALTVASALLDGLDPLSPGDGEPSDDPQSPLDVGPIDEP